MNNPAEFNYLKDSAAIPLTMVPSAAVMNSMRNGTNENILLHVWGGLGDQICAEPTIRYAFEIFKGCKISLAAETPDLFTHLKFEKVYLIGKDEIPWDKYFSLSTIVPPTHFLWEFMCHMLTNAVDFSSICALRMQVPIHQKDIRLSPPTPGEEVISISEKKNAVYIHAGKHWPSKTFPKWWWDIVLSELIQRDLKPILIGANSDDNRGTVDVSTAGCIDLRNKLTIIESIWLLHRAKVLLTNDSSPLHMAVCGNAWIGFIASCKHPDYISHWRENLEGKNEWSWRMKNFGKGGMWDVVSRAPNSTKQVNADQVDQATLESWLPNPREYAEWALGKVNESS